MGCTKWSILWPFVFWGMVQRFGFRYFDIVEEHSTFVMTFEISGPWKLHFSVSTSIQLQFL